MKNILIAVILFVNVSPFAQGRYFPPLNSSGWDTLSSQSLGWQADSLNALQTFLGDKNTKAFIVLKSGRIVVEWYYDAFKRDSLWYWASAGKTLTAFLVGMAQESGYLSTSDTTADYLGAAWTHCPSEK